MTDPQVSGTLDVCASDPNFAVIFAFCERFGHICGVTIPTFQELQEMLENTTEVPDALVDIHVKLLRRVKKTVHADKWERALLKFSQGYSIPGFWELEHNGYKGISIHLKLKILKALFEAQFDSNVKFKAEINKLESSMLRSQPLGWDKCGTSYWVQFDRAYNIRVYKEDSEEDKWEIVAKDRSSLVNLINKLSGAKNDNINLIDDSTSISSIETGSEAEINLSQSSDQTNPTIKIENHMSENSNNVESEKSLYKPEQNSFEIPINLKRKLESNSCEDKNLPKKISSPIVGEAIEEPVIIVKGEGSGNECDTGNPDEIDTQNETAKNEDVKKPKLWSIETICSSSKEVKDEIISVPKTGFFFGDDSVPCFNNVSNGESSHPEENDEDDEALNNKKSEEIDSTLTLNIVSPFNKECSTKNEDELSSKMSLKQSVFNIKVHEEEVQITERNANEVFRTSDSNINTKIHKTHAYESSPLDTFSKSQDSQLNSSKQVFKTNEFNPLNTSGEANTVENVCQKKIDDLKVNSVNEEISCKNIDDSKSEKKPICQANVDINKDKKIGIEENLKWKSKENSENYQQLTTNTVDQIIITNDDGIKINKQSTNETNQSDEKKKKYISSEKVESHAQQSTEKLEKNQCALNELTQSKVLDIVTDNQILTNCNVIDNKQVIVNLVKDKEVDQNLSKDISADFKTIENSQKNITCSNPELNQHNVCDNSTLPFISGDCSRSSSSKTYDQTETDNVDQYFKISKQVDDINCKKLKNTAHNISNIIETGVFVSDIKTNDDNDSKQLEGFQIKKENKLIVNLDCPIVSNKHTCDKILQKSDQAREISENESTKDQAESSNFEIDTVHTVKYKTNIKEIKTKCLDVSKDEVADEKNTDAILLDGECVPKNEGKEMSINIDSYKQKLKINKRNDEYIKNVEEEGLKTTLKEQSVTFPVHKDVDESAGEANEETFMESSKDEYDDCENIDHSVEDDKKSFEVEETPKKKRKPPVRKKGKKGRAKKNIVVKQDSKINTEERVKKSYKPRQKKVVTIAEEVIVFPEPAGDDNIRRSRRIAEIKIKEQFTPIIHYDDIDIPLKSPKKKDKGGKKGSISSTMIPIAAESDNEEEDSVSKKFRKKKRKGKTDLQKKINTKSPWTGDSGSSSSENNVGLFEDYDHEEEDEILRPGIEPNVSDHEFSPESDINDDDEEYFPEKRARTAHKKDQGEQLKDDMSCQKCHNSDQPEWILLCDTCNQGWHASCLRPPLMVIPDGDWYCPPCRHEALLTLLKDTLKKFDGESKKRENEELRRKRLAYVGISLQNVISAKTEKNIVEQESSESESYDSEPLYQLRARRQAHVSYRFNDYDDMINEAILETSIDESVVKPVEVKTDKNDNDEKTDSDDGDNAREDSPIAPALLHLRGRKKSKKLTNLDVSSDDGSDEDFKGPSDGDFDDYEEELSEYSDDSVKKRPQPTRRSARNRRNVVDPDFINDNSSEDGNQDSKKSKTSKKRPWSDSSNSEEDDSTWGKKNKKRTNVPSSSLSFKFPKTSKRKRSENNSFKKPKKSKIKYGMDSDSGSSGQTKRRTRGRQITYAESDDSEEEIQPKKRKVAIDEEDEYVLNDDELEAEKEDHNLEVDDDDDDDDDDDTVASNEDKDEDDEVDDEEIIEDEEGEEEDEDDQKPALKIPQHTAVKSPSLKVQSVISESPTAPVLKATDFDPHHNEHQRLLPSTEVVELVNPKEDSSQSSIVGTPEKRKRPQHQLKKLPSLNPHSVDYSGGGYPYLPDATKVVQSSIPPMQIGYSGTPSQESSPVTASDSGGFKSMTVVPLPPGSFPATSSVPYRSASKGTAESVAVPAPQSPTYLSPQVQQVYQTAPSANYSPYPIDYATSTAPLLPPPPTVAFRNVVTVPSSSQELLQLPTTQQSVGVTSAGDSEFGGLVSYFSSQQEDDFDT